MAPQRTGETTTETRIPDDEVWQFKECFDWFDKDGDGLIRAVEVPVAVRAAGQYWSFGELRDLAKEFKPNASVSFDQFLSICSRKYGVSPDLSAMDRAFEVFDRERTGQIFLEDLRHVISSVGEKLTHREFEELCAMSGIVYRGGSQTINKHEFLTLFGATPRRRPSYQ